MGDPCFARSALSASAQVVNETRLAWASAAWIPLYARLELPANVGANGVWPRCTHPLCTGSDRAHFP